MENENVMADLINDGSPFGVIFIIAGCENAKQFGIIFIASNSDNPIDIDEKTKKLKSCFRDDRNNSFCTTPITISGTI